MSRSAAGKATKQLVKATLFVNDACAQLQNLEQRILEEFNRLRKLEESVAWSSMNLASKDTHVGKRKKSPCIDVCDFSGTKGWCRGCGRTREEVPWLEDPQAVQAQRPRKRTQPADGKASAAGRLKAIQQRRAPSSDANR